MTADRTTLALRGLAYRLFADRLRAADTANRAAIAESFPLRAREPVWLAGPDGEPIEVGMARKDAGAVSAHVSNMGELIDWCEKHALDWIEEYQPALVTRVKPAHLNALLAQAKTEGAARSPLGEVVPGIEVTTGDPKVVIVPAKSLEAEVALVEALKSDPYALQSLLSLPSPE